MTALAFVAIVTNIGFTVGWDCGRQNPSWVSYDLEPEEVVNVERKPYSFRADDRLPFCDHTEFFRWCGKMYDRGHLAPAADFNWDTNALKQTYLFSNICPMTPKLNRGAWKKTEDEVRALASSGTVHIVMFPQYENDISIPDRYVKVAWGWFGVRMWQLENK